MAVTKKQVEEALIRERIKVEDKIRDSEQRYLAPDIEQAGVIMWAELPAAIKAEVRKRNPELAKRLEDKLKRGNNGKL